MSMKEEYTAIDMATAAADGFRAGQRAAQSAGVPDVSAMARVLSDRSADACNIDRTDNWAMYGQEYIEDVQAMLAAPTVKAEQVGMADAYVGAREDLAIWKRRALEAEEKVRNQEQIIDHLTLEAQGETRFGEPSLPTAGSADLTAVRCQCCAAEYPHDSYDAGFIAGSGMCQVCDAAMPPKDLPAAGSAVEEVEVVAYLGDGGTLYPNKKSADKYLPVGRNAEPLMTVSQHDRIVAALSAQQSDPWAPSGTDYDRAIHHNPDAKAWADLFVATFPGQADKHDLMIGWFANAMMAMHDYLSARQSAQPEFCCKHSYKVAKQAAWGARDLTQCKCDHNEYCEHCWPDDFREGGKWHGGFETKQSAPERVSVPRDLLADLISSDHDTKIQAERALYALLASHGRGEA